MRSGIYKGWVSHRRFSPKKHAFRYRVFMMYLCLSELQDVLKMSPLWSTKRFSIARFKREDFHGDPKDDLDDAVKRTVEKVVGVRPKGDVCVLANLRYFGFNMNPLCTYYCFDESGEHVVAILAEVTNTPWHERRAYVLDCREDQQTKHRFKKWQSLTFDKDFTVSPFNPLDMQYSWRSSTPSQRLNVHIETAREGKKVTDATLRLQREEINAKNLSRIVLSFPFMTFKVALAIYWQALLLAIKGVPFLGKDKMGESGAKDAAADEVADKASDRACKEEAGHSDLSGFDLTAEASKHHR